MSRDRDHDGRRGDAPLTEARRLYEKTSSKGRRYLTGHLGGLRVIVFQNDTGEGEHSHVLMIGAAPPTQGNDRGGRR